MKIQGKLFQAEEQPWASAKAWRQEARQRQRVEAKEGGGPHGWGGEGSRKPLGCCKLEG